MKFGGDSPELDAIDLQIIALLQEHGRIPLVKLGEQVGLSAPSVNERVKKLEDGGVIIGYHATVDATRLGKDVTAFIGVSIAHPKTISLFEESVALLDDVLECHHVTGQHTLLLKIKTENTASLERLISSIRSIEGVGADGDDGGAVNAYRARLDFAAHQWRRERAGQRPAASPRLREIGAAGFKAGVMMHNYRSVPKKQGLYDPAHEHDACGVGFVVNIKGERSHDIVAKGLQVLDNLTHRGACGCDPRTGDGAGILIQIPHEFFAGEAARLGFKLPAAGEYGVGQVFLPLDAVKRRECEDAFERIVNRGRSANPRMARRAGGRGGVRRYRAARDACDSPGLHRAQCGRGGRRGARAQAVRNSQARHDRGGKTRSVRS